MVIDNAHHAACANVARAQLNHLVELYGHDARLYLLRCLVDHIDFRDQKSGKDALKVGLLNQELAKVSSRQNFVSIVCQALEQVSITEDFLQIFVKMVKLSLRTRWRSRSARWAWCCSPGPSHTVTRGIEPTLPLLSLPLSPSLSLRHTVCRFLLC